MLPNERILLGPGPSLMSPRVMHALALPVLSHLDPEFVPMLDDVRGLLQRVFRADAKALTLATELGLRPLMAHCHLGLGKLAWHAGQPAKARDEFGAATTMWREMDVRFWFEQAEAELRQLV